MPIQIIKQDITKLRCDAIVNPTNEYMIPGGGVDAAIHDAAGNELMVYCSGLGGCKIGEAKLTPAFNLPCKHIIHTVGPSWCGGNYNEELSLRSCYLNSLKIAKKLRCSSIAFPLISSGCYGYPKDSVLRVAVDVIDKFLSDYEMMVYIVVYDKDSFSVSPDLLNEISRFIDHSFEESVSKSARVFEDRCATQKICAPLYASECRYSSDSLDRTLANMLSAMDKGFRDTLFYYIDKKGISDVDCYKRSNVGKKTFSKIKCNPDYRPSKVTAVSFAIGLRLNLEETEHLLSTAGMCLSRSSIFDVIIEYFVTNGNYNNIFDVNEVLYQFDQPLLGV